MSNSSYGPQVKDLLITGLKADLETAEHVFITSFAGLGVKKVDELRKKLRLSGTRYRVVKNTLIKKVLSETEFNGLVDTVESQVGIGLSKGEVSEISKIFVDFGKENETFQVRSLSFGGNTYSDKQVTALAKLPSRHELLSMVCGALNAPIQGTVTVLSGVIRNFVNVLDQVKNQKNDSSK
jgi:large subunit ribosomal protein L10